MPERSRGKIPVVTDGKVFLFLTFDDASFVHGAAYVSPDLTGIVPARHLVPSSQSNIA